MEVIRTFDSLLDFAEAANAESVLREEQRASRTGAYSFCATRSYQEARNLMLHGWEVGFKKMLEIGDVQKISVEVIKRRWDFAGGQLDMGAYIAGQPDCYMRVVRKDEPTYVDIMVNVSVAGMYDTDVLFRRCLIVASVAEVLTRMGYLVSIKVYDVAERYGKYTAGVHLKKYGDKLDIYNMVFALGHPSMLRRMFFSLEECEPKEIVYHFGFHSGAGYGAAAEVGERYSKNTIYFGRPSHSLTDLEDEVARVIDEYHKRIASDMSDTSDAT